METAEQIRALITPALGDQGVGVYDVELAGAILRVLVERPGGIDIDAISEATRTVSRLLDEHDPMPGRYTLEVSSPGLERPLRRPEHFAGAVDSRVRIRTHGHVEGERRVVGTVVEADDDAVTVRLDEGDDRRVRYDDIEKARTVFEWGPAPKPGSPSKQKSASSKKKRAATS